MFPNVTHVFVMIFHEMSAYEQTIHVIFGTVTIIAGVVHRLRRRTFHLKNQLKKRYKHLEMHCEIRI